MRAVTRKAHSSVLLTISRDKRTISQNVHVEWKTVFVVFLQCDGLIWQSEYADSGNIYWNLFMSSKSVLMPRGKPIFNVSIGFG
jgi:hypothetical protein